MNPAWPASELEAGETVIKECDTVVASAEHLLNDPTEIGRKQLLTALINSTTSFGKLEFTLATELDAEHGKGTADSKRFRTYMRVSSIFSGRKP